MTLSFVQLGEVVADYIERHPGWNRSDLYVDFRSRGIAKARIDRAVNRLIELGWVKEMPSPAKGGEPRLYWLGTEPGRAKRGAA